MTIEDFLDFLIRLDNLVKGKPFVVFMDNLSVHRSKKVRELMDQLKIEPIFNVAYSPEYNPIELCFT